MTFNFGLVALVALSIVGTALSHSFLTCTDYRPPGALHSGVTSEPKLSNNEHCFGRPRNFRTFLMQADGYAFRPTGPQTACDPQKQKRFSNATGNYDNEFKMAHYRPGSDVCVEWPARNHAKGFNGPFAGGHNNMVFMQKTDPAQDPSQSEFNSNMLKEFPYSDCSEQGGSANRPCRGCFSLPAGMASGQYTFQWVWEFNDNEWYSTCWDAQVDNAGRAFKAPAGTVGPDKDARMPPAAWGRAPLDGAAPPPSRPAPPPSRPTQPPSRPTQPPSRPTQPPSRPTQPPMNGGGGAASGPVGVVYKKAWEAGNGFGATIEVKPQAAIKSWTVSVTFTAGQKVTNSWSSTRTESGNTFKFSNTNFNGEIPAGGSQSFGFNASKAGSNPDPQIKIEGTYANGQRFSMNA